MTSEPAGALCIPLLFPTSTNNVLPISDMLPWPCPSHRVGLGLVSKTHSSLGLWVCMHRSVIPPQTSADQGLGNGSFPLPMEWETIKKPHSIDSALKYSCSEHCHHQKAANFVPRKGLSQLPSSKLVPHSSSAQGGVSLPTVLPTGGSV